MSLKWTVIGVLGGCLLSAMSFAAQEVARPQPIGAAPASETAATQSSSGGVTTQAIVPQLIKFNGEVRDSSGKPITGTSDVTFAIYSQQEGGEPLWFETQSVGLDAMGRYTVLLGAMRGGVPLDLFTSGEARWLGVQVGNGVRAAKSVAAQRAVCLEGGGCGNAGRQAALRLYAERQFGRDQRH
jgi:hypothetical protein